VRGTMEILRHEFGLTTRARLGVGGPPDAVNAQSAAEKDAGMSSFVQPVSGEGGRWSLGWWVKQANNRLGTSFHPNFKLLKPQVQTVSVVLEVGGDHYSLDYGRPLHYIAMDQFLQSLGLPVVIWGASVGPFDADPKFAPQMFDHLRSLSAVFVRESDSYNYLHANGVSENVHLMADPAFVMQPEEPSAAKIGFALPEGAIGINLSPMVAFYRGQRPKDVDLKEWLSCCVQLVKSAASLKRPILLVPHAGSSNPGNDDFALLNSLCKVVQNELSVPVRVLPNGLNAAELKWIIARCAVFAGARTHSTIAALSSHVPTLSIGYSAKAKGINHDVFGHLDFCIHVSELTSSNFTAAIGALLDNQDNLRGLLRKRIPELQARALAAGRVLRNFCIR